MPQQFLMLRTLRIIRPLRAIVRIPSLRILVTVVAQTGRPLFCAAFLTMVLTTSLGVIGVDACQGKLRNYCFALENGLRSETSKSPWNLGPSAPRVWFLFQGHFICDPHDQCLSLSAVFTTTRTPSTCFTSPTTTLTRTSATLRARATVSALPTKSPVNGFSEL